MLRIGQIASERPLSRSSGFDRGTPIDRYYIERFRASGEPDAGGSEPVGYAAILGS